MLRKSLRPYDNRACYGKRVHLECQSVSFGLSIGLAVYIAAIRLILQILEGILIAKLFSEVTGDEMLG